MLLVPVDCLSVSVLYQTGSVNGKLRIDPGTQDGDDYVGKHHTRETGKFDTNVA